MILSNMYNILSLSLLSVLVHSLKKCTSQPFTYAQYFSSFPLTKKVAATSLGADPVPSLQAYKQWVERNGEEKLLPGISLTHDQLFFLNYARIWCGTMRPEDALSKIRSSVHSLGPIRVLGPLSNSIDFAKSYNCPVGSRMNPEKKCSVW